MATKGNLRIAHVSDIHFRGLKRHGEYRRASEILFRQLRERDVDAIFIGGDIVHSKVQNITPEMISLISWWFNELAEIAPVVTMLGNHDGLVFNTNRMDTISPIVESLNNPNILLYRDTGIYPMTLEDDAGNERLIHWCILSPFDEQQGAWEKMLSVPPNSEAIRIGGYHGSVASALTDQEWALRSTTNTSLFDSFDFTMLGDIHRYQTLDAPAPCGYGRIVYSGSLIQQNFGETPEKGWVLWTIEDVDNFKHELVLVPNEAPFLTADWDETPEKTVSKAMKSWGYSAIPEKARIRLRASSSLSQLQSNRVKEIFKSKGHKAYFKRHSITEGSSHQGNSDFISEEELRGAAIDVQDSETLFGLYKEWVESGGQAPWIEGDSSRDTSRGTSRDSTSGAKDKSSASEDKLTDAQMELLESSFGRLRGPMEQVRQNSETVTGVNWSIKRISWDNIFAYGEGNSIDFTGEDFGTIFGVFGPNGVGKSTVTAVLMYALFNGTDRGAMSNGEILNDRCKTCSATVELRVGNRDLLVKRSTEKVERFSRKENRVKVNYKTSLDVSEKVGGVWVELSGEQRRDTDKILRGIIGGPEDFTIVSFAPQGAALEFIDSGGSKRRQALMRLLNLSVIDEISKIVKEVSAEDRAWSKKGEGSESLAHKLQALELEEKDLKTDLEEAQSTCAALESELADIKFVMSKDQWEQLEYHRQRIANLNEKLDRKRASRDRIQENLKNYRETFKKSLDALEGKSLDRLESEAETLGARLEEHRKLQNKLNGLQRDLEDNQRQEKNLEGIPCGEQYPGCPYIKDAFVAREESKQIRKAIEHLGSIGDDSEIKEDLDKVNRQISDLKEAKIRCAELETRVDEALSSFSETKEEIATLEGELEQAQAALDEVTQQIERSAKGDSSSESDSQESIDEAAEKESDLIRRHKELTGKIKSLNEKQLDLKTEIGINEHKQDEVRVAISDAKETEQRLLQWDSLLAFLGPKGVLQMILRRQLPLINGLIAKHLGEFVEFGVRLHMEDDSKQLDVILDWGDKSRGVESASGMQKLISAIAIRAALHSITPLPKSDLLIMDEGFGALDPDSLAGAFEMLEMYRQSYGRILLISHIDTVKEAVDIPLTVTVDDHGFSGLSYDPS